MKCTPCLARLSSLDALNAFVNNFFPGNLARNIELNIVSLINEMASYKRPVEVSLISDTKLNQLELLNPMNDTG